MAWRPEEQKRLTVVAGMASGSPARMTATLATLCPCWPLGSAQPDPVRGKVFSSGDWATMVLDGKVTKFDALLTPRSYVAVVEGSPFLEQALKGARVRESESIVLGLMAE